MIEVYAGQGASHSLVWLVDLLLSARISEARLIGADDVGTIGERRPSCVVVSGGDGYDIAGSIGSSGFSSLSEYISDGGLYIGMCAGAYLPLPSRLEPFSSFNLSGTKIRNLGTAVEGDPARSVPYGSCSILQPVRGMVSLEGPAGKCIAPTYGGPVFSEPDEDEVLLRFISFVDDTEFQISRDSAERMMIGSPAAISCRHGEGRLLLFGPHIEFPGCHEGNRIFLGLLPADQEGRPGRPHSGDVAPYPGLDRAIADLKVAILGLENRSFVSSSKAWDGGRLMEILDAIGRMRRSVCADRSQEVVALLSRVRSRLISFDETGAADMAETPYELVEAFRICANERLAMLRR